MRYQELTEGKNTPCIVVDIQPAYAESEWQSFGETHMKTMEFLANQNGPVLMFVNAEETGVSEDTIEDIEFYWNNGLRSVINDRSKRTNKIDNFWSRTTIVDKGYGHFRSWMDQGMSDGAIIKTIRLMYQNKVNDSRMLFGGEDSDDYEINFQAFLDDDYQDIVLDEPLVVEWTSVAQLKQFSGSYIMGGGRNECLREVELLMNAFNIKYKRIEEFVYG